MVRYKSREINKEVETEIDDRGVYNAYKIIPDVRRISKQTGKTEREVLEILKRNDIFISNSNDYVSCFGKKDMFGNSL